MFILCKINPYDAKGLGYRLYAALHKLPREVVKLSPRHIRKPLQYIPQQGQSFHILTTSLSTTGCYKNKYTIKFFWVACISRFAIAILSGETELALGTIRVNIMSYLIWNKNVWFATYFYKYIHFNLFMVIFILTCMKGNVLMATMDIADQFLLQRIFLGIYSIYSNILLLKPCKLDKTVINC